MSHCHGSRIGYPQKKSPCFITHVCWKKTTEFTNRRPKQLFPASISSIPSSNISSIKPARIISRFMELIDSCVRWLNTWDRMKSKHQRIKKMVIWWDFMGLNGDLRGFNGFFKCWFYGDMMGFYGDFIVIWWDFMGLNGDLRGFNGFVYADFMVIWWDFMGILWWYDGISWDLMGHRTNLIYDMMGISTTKKAVLMEKVVVKASLPNRGGRVSCPFWL